MAFQKGVPMRPDILAKRVATQNSPEVKARMREAMLALWSDRAYRRRQSEAHKGGPGRLGRRHSEKTLERLRLSHLGQRRTLESRLKQGASIRGTRHHNWKGGPIPHNHRGEGWHTIKAVVRERAGGHCEFCGGINVRGWQLDVHHVVPYREIPVTADWACLALCRRCHIRADRRVIDTSALQAKLRPLLEIQHAARG